MAFTLDNMASAFSVLGDASEDSDPEAVVAKAKKTLEEERAEKERIRKEKAKQLKKEKALKEKNAKKMEVENSENAKNAGSNFTNGRPGNQKPMGGGQNRQQPKVQQPIQAHREGVEIKRTGGSGGGGGGSAGPRRGGYGGRGRQFDRHSGSDRTGIKSIDKRDGAGAHNWGTVQDEMNAGAQEDNEATGESNAQAQTTDKPAGEGAEGDAQAESEAARQPPEPAYISIRDFQAQEASRKKALREQLGQSEDKSKARRKANDGQDAAFANMVVYRKKNDSDEEEEDSDEEEDEDQQKKNTVKFNLRYSGRVSETMPRGGGRGGRGGGPGGRGGQSGGRGGDGNTRFGGGERGGYQRGANKLGGSSATPALDNVQDFPELGSAKPGKHV